MSRTIAFDRNEVLQKAMTVFWKDGYSKSSISNLVIATNLKPGSIYAAFESKEGLFLAALDNYAQQFISELQVTLDNAPTPLQGIKDFIEKITAEVLAKNQQFGCFLVNTVLETSPEETLIIDKVNKHLKKIECILCSTLTSACEAGELPSTENPEILAKYLMVSIWGLRVLAKTNPDDQSVRAITDKIFESLDKLPK